MRHAQYGLMKADEAPDRPWKSISMDSITDLPLSEASDAVLFVIDRLTKMARFRPSMKDMNARQFQETFMREIFRLHGLPRDIITDRGSIFTSDLWKETTKKLGIERRLSTAFHPQTDGQRNGQIPLWNNISDPTSTTSRRIGKSSYQWPNSHTIMDIKKAPRTHHSSRITEQTRNIRPSDT